MATRGEWRDDARGEDALWVPSSAALSSAPPWSSAMEALWVPSSAALSSAPPWSSAMEAFPQQGQMAFVDCPSCQTPNQFPQTQGAVTMQCGNCSRQFQAAGQPSLTKVLSMSSVPMTNAQQFESGLPFANPMPLSPTRTRSLSVQRTSPTVSMTASGNPEANRDGEVANPYDGISPDVLVHDAISRCEQRTAAIAARTRELLVKFGEYSPPRLSHSCLHSAVASNLVPGSVPMPSPLARGDRSFSTTAFPEASQFQRTMSLQVVPSRQPSPMQGARSFSTAAPPGSQSFSLSALQPMPMMPQRHPSPMPGLGHRIRQGPSAAPPSFLAALGNPTMAPPSPAGAMRPRSLSPRPLPGPGGFLSFVPTAPALAPPLSPALGMRSHTPSPWPAHGSVTALMETSTWVPVPSSPILSVRSRSCSPMRMMVPSRNSFQSAFPLESSLLTNTHSRSSNDCAPKAGLGSWLPSQMIDQEVPKTSHAHINGDFRPKEAEIPSNSGSLKKELGESITTNPGLEDPSQRRPASGRTAVGQATLNASQAWEDLANAVVCSGTAADLASTSLQGRSKLASPSAVPALDSVELQSKSNWIQNKSKEPIEAPTSTSEAKIAADALDWIQTKKDSGRPTKPALDRGAWVR